MPTVGPRWPLEVSWLGAALGEAKRYVEVGETGTDHVMHDPGSRLWEVAANGPGDGTWAGRGR
jgi:hypothetical protein